MKRFFVRYYEWNEDKIPVDSDFICWSNADTSTQMQMTMEFTNKVVSWMRLHPNGKVDFVWL